MTMTKAIIKSTTNGIDVRVGYDDDANSTEEERSLAVQLGLVINEYLKLTKMKEVAK